MKRRLCAVVASLSLLAMSVMGCVSDNKKDDNTSTEVQSENEGNNASERQKDTVVASSVAVVQILDALGVEMVGVPTSSYELPESVKEAKRIGNPMSPDMEVIASLEPTVVVSVDTLSEDLNEQFKSIGAESFFVDLSSYNGLKESIVKIGERFGVKESAESIVKDFEAKEEKISKLSENKEGPSVLIIFGASGSFMVASENTYVGDLLKQVGGDNIIKDSPAAFSPVDMEYLANENPEYILFMAHANPEESLKAFEKEFETNVAWQSFDAVKNNKVIALETGYFGMSANLFAADAMEKLANILYGEN